MVFWSKSNDVSVPKRISQAQHVRYFLIFLMTSGDLITFGIWMDPHSRIWPDGLTVKAVPQSMAKYTTQSFPPCWPPGDLERWQWSMSIIYVWNGWVKGFDPFYWCDKVKFFIRGGSKWRGKCVSQPAWQWACYPRSLKEESYEDLIFK